MTKNSNSPYIKTQSTSLDDSKDLTQLQQKLQQLKDFYANGSTSEKEQKNKPQDVSSPILPVKNGTPPLAKKEVKTVVETSKSPVTSDVQAIQKEAKRKRFQQLKLALEWLQETYPLCFKKQDPLPLKKRIEKDIFIAFPEGLSFSKVSVREALHYYTSSTQYRTNLMTASHRYNLLGEAIEEVTPQEQQLAEQQLALFAAKKKQWAEKKKNFVKKTKINTP